MTISTRAASSSRARRGGFSLIELLLAIFILGVGIIAVASVFPAGIIQQRRTQDDVLGPVVAEAALGTIRAKLSQADFGTFEQFGLFDSSVFNALGQQGFPNSWLADEDAYTQVGDWPWLRPSMAAAPLNASPSQWPTYAGDIDIFSARAAHSSSAVGTDARAPILDYPSSLDWNDGWRTTELGTFGGAFPVFSPGYNADPTSGDPEAFLFGIPYNRTRYSVIQGGVDPLVTITQEERFWPVGSGFGPGQTRPEFAWDCMFRRYQGRVQVAIFVYRLKISGTPGGYVICQDSGSVSQARDPSRPPMPARVDFLASVGGVNYRPLTPIGTDSTPDDLDANDANRNVVPATTPDFNSPNNLIALDPYFEGWQQPGQWLLDPYGRLHRVLQGRRNKRQGPVRLSRPVPTQVPSPTLVNPANASDAADWQRLVDEVRSIWFIPPNDRRGIGLEPVYVSVRDL